MIFSTVFYLSIISLLLAIPAGLDGHRFAMGYFTTALVQGFTYACVITFITRGNVKWKRALLTVVYLLFCTECFIYFKFGSRFDPNILTMILQTSWGEVREFFGVYMLSVSSLISIIVCVGGYLLLWRTVELRWRIKFTEQKWVKWCIGALFALGLCMPFIPLPFSMGLNTINRFVSSGLFVAKERAGIDRITETLDNVTITSTPDEKEAPCITLVIGESFSKKHSSLYGYTLPTNPQLNEELRSGNLYRFDKATTPAGSTHAVMRYLFTLKGCEHKGVETPDAREFVLMPNVFKLAGYEVRYFDNQYTRSAGGTLDYSCGYFLNPKRINDACFDYRNTETAPFDGDFVEMHEEYFCKKNKSLNIIHLMGQHFDPKQRFPASKFERFSTVDIKRPELSEAQRKQVANYDNATFYNDYVLGQIIDNYRDSNAIIIYLSDHGEQIYDGATNNFGRAGSIDDKVFKECIFDVPFMVWCSDKFRENHRDMCERISRATSLDICTADLPYFLFDIAGIDFNYNFKVKSYISPDYQPHEIKF
ncbi:MAG: phosphoethanolamine transferase [Bacteroidaceae bacterium]|nr:phosphoethanolamine transferase [Bacteroidaceae bacterium]